MPDGSEIISLPFSRLYVRGDALVKEGYSNETIAKHPIADIQEASIEQFVSYRSMMLFLVCGILAFICKIVIQGMILSWCLTLFFTLISVFNLFVIKRTNLKISTSQGEMTYDLTDSLEEVKGFELSLSEMISRKTTATF